MDSWEDVDYSSLSFHSYVYEDFVYIFCSDRACKDLFDLNPLTYMDVPQKDCK